MFETILRNAAVIFAFFHAAAPIAIRSTFRFAGCCKPVLVSPGELPSQASSPILRQIPEIEALGFECAGIYDCGELASNTRSYIAYFVNRKTNDFANVSVVISPNKVASYCEFSTRLSNGLILDTNNNAVLPLSPANPQGRIFRFSKISQPKVLYEVHQQLLAKYSEGFAAEGEPKGREIERLIRIVENYGVRHTAIGYMYLDPESGQYRLTWKGAVLMTWRALWPSKLVLQLLHRQKTRNELRSLQVSGTTALQKA